MSPDGAAARPDAAAPAPDVALLEGLVARLEHVAAQLRDAELEPEAAAALVDACAQAAAQASGELERLVRAAASEPAPGQDQLL